MEVILGQKEAKHHGIQAGHALDVGDDGHAAAFAQIKRGTSPNRGDRRVGSLEGPRQYWGLIARRVRTSRRHHDIRVAFVLIDELKFHPFGRARTDRIHDELFDFIRLLIGYEPATDFGEGLAGDDRFCSFTLITTADAVEF